jgi:hypothetical protein
MAISAPQSSPPRRGRIVITLGWRFFAKVAKDDEPIFDSFFRRGNVAAPAMPGQLSGQP